MLPRFLFIILGLSLAACSQKSPQGGGDPLLPRYRTQQRLQNKLDLAEKRWDRHPGIQRRLEMDEKLGQLRGGPQKPKPDPKPVSQ